MPITPSRNVADPYAPLAWNTSIALAALEKLKRATDISGEERSALDRVAKDLDLLAKASQIRYTDSPETETETLPPYLRKNYFSLVAIGGESSIPGKPLEFKKAGEDLHKICQLEASGNTKDLDPHLLETAQQTCLELLENLNDRRPNSTTTIR
jgi:hypothetical protein